MKNIFSFILILTVCAVLLPGRAFSSGKDTSSTIVAEQVVAAYDNHENQAHQQSAIQAHAEVATEHAEGEESAEGHGENAMAPLLFFIIAIVIGAATRHFFSKIPVPFTVLLLVFGLALGMLLRFNVLEGWGGSLAAALNWAAEINPHLILFVFLPTLIFEAAFALDVHTFKKTSTNAIILAVPGILICTFLTGLLMIGIDMLGIGLHGWGRNAGFIALMFGAVISATDPVAVTALLKELGASKKLGTLIEGESMLNDGTAIVIFMVFYVPLTVAVAATNPIADFFTVAFGGTLLGLVIALVSIAWVKRVFNDILIEISVIIAAAYATFYIAESILGVSGVLGLVALGITMAGIGKTRISPEVQHFLHEFWELAAFIANTLIFIIVGVIIAERTMFSWGDFTVLIILFVALHAIRALMITMMYPFMRRIGYGLDFKNATVLWYGALRGAIALALALVVVELDYNTIPEPIRDKFGFTPAEFDVIKNQFLFLTAGIVTLTLLINATTIKFLVNKLGLTKVAPAKQLMFQHANEILHGETRQAMEELKSDRYIKNATWEEVELYLPVVPRNPHLEGLSIDKVAEIRKRLLEKEKHSYWQQFKKGMLSSTAVRRLSDRIDELMDKEGEIALSERKDLEAMLKTSKLLNRLYSSPLFRRPFRRMFLDQLAVSYDCARGFVEAQEMVLSLVESMRKNLEPGDKEGAKILNQCEDEINQNTIEGTTFIRDLRKTYPEIYDSIATRQAIRTLLNDELKTIGKLQTNGQIETDEAARLVAATEEKMKKLLHKPPKIKATEATAYLKEIGWDKELEQGVADQLAGKLQAKMFSVGAHLMREGGTPDGIYLVARGSSKIVKNNNIIDFAGEGKIVGEIGILTEKPRVATVTAATPVTAFWISKAHLSPILEDSPKLLELMWKTAARRLAGNILKAQDPYASWNPKKLRTWLEKGELVSLKPGDTYEFSEEKICVLISGNAKLTASNNMIESPIIIATKSYKMATKGYLFVLGK
ncbi:MAG: cation:proton antiporter [Bacteroidetes bacterium]|nr:cation:proton antiporter [Bacteroidota bacterium]MBU1717460.1 cation:proton antiporter [Bacteroidota bacterium]